VAPELGGNLEAILVEHLDVARIVVVI